MAKSPHPLTESVDKAEENYTNYLPLERRTLCEHLPNLNKIKSEH